MLPVYRVGPAVKSPRWCVRLALTDMITVDDAIFFVFVQLDAGTPLKATHGQKILQ